MNEFWREARLKLFSYAVAALSKFPKVETVRAPGQWRPRCNSRCGNTLHGRRRSRPWRPLTGS